MFISLLEVFLISIVPISLIRFGILPTRFRLVALFGIFVLLIIFIYVQGISLVQLGITTENFSSAVLPYASAAGISIFGLIVLAKIMKNKSAEKWYRDPHFLFLFIPISFAQQFVFQGFILFKLESVFFICIRHSHHRINFRIYAYDISASFI
jgi:hypothetical protein